MNENLMDIEAGPIIQFDKVNKWFENFHVLKDIDLKDGRGAVSYTHLTLPTSDLV